MDMNPNQVCRKENVEMNTKAEAIVSFTMALFVLISAMFDPRISAGLAVVFLVALAICKLTHRG
jgi:hypothetical protein